MAKAKRVKSDYSKDLEAAVFHGTDAMLRGFLQKALELKQSNDDAIEAVMQGSLLALCHVMVRKGKVPEGTAEQTCEEFAAYASDCMQAVMRSHGKMGRMEKESATVN